MRYIPPFVKFMLNPILLYTTPAFFPYICSVNPCKEEEEPMAQQLWNGEDIEVLEPLWLRKEIAGKIKRMLNKYNKEELV